MMVSEVTYGVPTIGAAAAVAAVNPPKPPGNRQIRSKAMTAGTAAAAKISIFFIAIIPTKMGTSNALIKINLNVAISGKTKANFLCFFPWRPEKLKNSGNEK